MGVEILQVLYSSDGYQASAGKIGRALGNTGKNPSSLLNAEMGRWGKRVANKYPVKFTRREDGTFRKWDIFFDGWQEKKEFIWKLRKEIIIAIETLGLIGEVQYAEELPADTTNKFYEGAKRIITVNSYERNTQARKKCIQNYGTDCSVCDVNFSKKYGAIGIGYIHVHHLKKISEIGSDYEINPIEDLRPVCPNCHSMIHQVDPPLTIAELKERLKQNELKAPPLVFKPTKD